MARPVRNTVDYFPHYISDGKKMYYIESKYGNDGYASWFKILETLASTDHHFIHLGSEIDIMYLSAKCKVSNEVLLSIINDLSKLGEIDDFLWQNKILYSRKFIDSIQDAYFRRNNKCLQYDDFCIHYASLCTTITQLMYNKNSSNTQSKVEYTKVDKSKEDLDNILISNYSISDCKLKEDNPEYEIYFVATKLYDFFKENTTNSDLEYYTLSEWIKPLRQIFKKKYTRDHIEELLIFAVEDKFWKSIIINTESLNKNFEKIKSQIINKNTNE